MFAMFVCLIGLRESSAQQLHGFVTGGIHSDGQKRYEQHYPGVGGGVLFAMMKSRFELGGQGDFVLSGGYASGRGGPVGQLNFIRNRALRPFAIAGVARGENSGPMFGAGVELWSRGRVRVSAHDYLAAATLHQASVQFGISWR